jgi:hypothetical protein
MKKLFLVLLITFFIGCSTDPVNQTISIEKPPGNQEPYKSEIMKRGSYSLDCKTHYYIGAVIGGSLIDETYIRVFEGNVRDTLYVDGASAKFFGADYTVLQDDSMYLVIIRHSVPSGVTEVVSINKDSGIGFDTKTLLIGQSGAPNTDTYILSCTEV